MPHQELLPRGSDLSDLTPNERSLRARLGGLTTAARHDPLDYTAAARAKCPGSLGYFERQVDPDRELQPAERERRAKAAQKAHFTRLGLKSAQARRRRRAA